MESHLATLCAEIKDDVDLKVIVANTARESIRETIDGVDVHRLGTSFHFAAAPICFDMANEIRQTQADIIQIHLPNPTAILAYFASGHSAKLVLSYHSDVLRQKLLARSFQPILDRALRASSAIIAATPKYIESSPVLRRHRERCQVIPYGIDLRAFDSIDQAQVREIRTRFGPRLILGLGRLVYYKGFEYVIRAMTQIDGHLVLVGDGPLAQPLRELVSRLGIAQKVTMLGEVADIAPYYHACDLFVFPSIARTEAFGIVQLEAMACRKPVVNTSVDSGVPYVSLDGITGLTVPPCQPEPLAAAVNTLLNDEPLRLRLGVAARRRVEQEFSLAVMGQRTLQVFSSVLNHQVAEYASH
ncbi:MAG TPA: glycosyltransferase [Bryobacteraceae bacterium]|nr:glycosyltransferase [Bryobacteraceae bacterium]